MFTTIKKELQKADKSIKDFQNQAVAQVKLLEAGDALDDQRMARALGTNTNFQRAEIIKGKKLEKENLSNIYKGEVFTISQIEALAIRYNLRFLRTVHYCGNIDTGVFQKLRDFSKETKTEITDEALKRNYFILAPEECFNLKHVARMKKDPDPAIFYQIDDNHYRFIHQWGSDFTFIRRLTGLWYQSREVRYVMLNFILMFVAIAATYYIIKDQPVIKTADGKVITAFKQYWGWFFASQISWIISGLILYANLDDEDSPNRRRQDLKYSEMKWKSDEFLDKTLPVEYYR